MAPETASDLQQIRIARALLQLLAEGGIEAVSVRTVAAHAGCSVGMVQRQFGTKDGLLTFAMQHAVARFAARIEAKLTRLAVEQSSTSSVLALLEELLRVDPEVKEQQLVWMAFTARASVEPRLARELHPLYTMSRAALKSLIEAEQAAHTLDPALDADQWALNLLALSEGLTLQLLIGSVTHDAAEQAVRAQLDALRPPSAEPGAAHRRAGEA